MPILLKEDYDYKLPAMYKVRQAFPRERIENVEETLREKLADREIKELIKPGDRVAVAVGSRGIRNLSVIVKTVIEEIKNMGGAPFIVSAMGSHGSGTEEGQRKMLEGYDITPETMGVEVITKVESVLIGETKQGIPVYFDKVALEADHIVPINRVKLHTDFVGDIQSGLCKMLVIGLGNHVGCSAVHEGSPEDFAEIIEEAATIILKKAPVAFGVATVENSYDETALIEVIPAYKIIEEEKKLVKIAQKNMPCIKLDKIDVLVVEEIGKDVSGAGYDPNILGRSTVLKTFVLHIPEFQKMVLLDLTEATHGNSIGVGLFDVITRNVFEKTDLEALYANAIACKCIDDAKIPIMAKDEDEAIRVALKGCRNIDKSNLKIVKIKNTLNLEYIWVSESMLPEVKAIPDLTLV